MKQMNGEMHIVAAQYAKEGEYWLDRLNGELVKTGFPVDSTLSPSGGFQPLTFHHRFSTQLSASLMKLRNGSDPRLFMILVAGVVMILEKYTGNNDIIIGSPIYKQEIEGEFINTILTLRNRLEKGMSFKDLLLQVRETVIKADENQNYPVETLLYKLGLTMSRSHFPLFDVVVLLENLHDPKYIDMIDPPILFSFSRIDEVIEVNVIYNSLCYQKTTIQRIMEHFSILLGKALEDVNAPITQFELISPEERNRLLKDFNNTTVEYDKNKTMHQLVEEQVQKTPDQAAVVFNDQVLTYSQLNSDANRIARYLREKGVEPGSIVGMQQPPSLERIAAMLGVLKAGGAYMPISPTAPSKRTVTMLKDSDSSLLLTRECHLENQSYTALQGLKEKRMPPIFSPKRKQILDLDSLPIPNRTLVDYEKYNRYIGQAMVTDIISLQTARGCPYRCAYCSRIWHDKHVFRSADKIFDELMLYYNMGVRRFSIFDDIFNVNIQNGMKFFKKIIDNKLKIQLYFPNGLRSDLLTREYIDLAVEAGLVSTALALETASPRLQKLINKNVNLDKFRDNAEYFCKKYPQVILEIFTIHGFPTETEEEAYMTMDFIKSLKWIHFPYVFMLKIYPDTEMEQIALDNGIHREDILRCEDLSFHNMSPTSPFTEDFSHKYQSDFLNNYFLSKERLQHVLPLQLKVLTQNELIQKYDSYLPADIRSFEDILDIADLKKEELKFDGFLDDNTFKIPDFNTRLQEIFPVKKPAADSLRVLFLDLSLYFSDSGHMLYDVVEPPLGAMYIMTYLENKLGDQVQAKIAKSRIDFDNYNQLKQMIDEYKPDVIALRTLTFYRDFFHATAEIIREWGIHVPIIAGGPYITRNVENVIQDRNIDIAIPLEGEVTFCEVIEKIIANDKKLPSQEVLKEIPGVVFAPRHSESSEQKEGKFAREIILFDHVLNSQTLSEYSVENLQPVNKPSDIAYIIYTSGSTGEPKGVMVEHRNALNVLNWYKKQYNLHEQTHVIQLSNYTFDPSIEQIFGTLSMGGVVYLTDIESLGQRENFTQFIDRHQIQVINFVPGTLKELIVPGEKLNSLRMIISGGEKLDEEVKNKILEKGYALNNHYGPTETTIDAIVEKCSPTETVKLGRPIFNTRCYILGKDSHLAPIGISGDLYIAGDGVTRGYLNNQLLTHEKFVDDPFVTSGSLEKMYKTGDIARWSETGKIEFLGRIDHQIKIRGYRVELGEIESHLKARYDIKDAVVIDIKGENENNFLCAYYVYDFRDETEIMPSVGDYCIWDDLLYYAMGNDQLKNNGYKIAIDRFVKDKTVVEVGTGKDMILALMAVAAGAKKVYAIEILEEYYLKAKEKLEELGLQDKIVLIHGDSRNIILPEKVDVNVTNQIGSIGSSEGAIVIHNDSRRFLKENHIVIPHHCITKIAAITLPEKIRKKPTFSQTSQEYLDKIFKKFDYQFDVRLCIQHLPVSHIISNEGIFENIVFDELMENEFCHKIDLTIRQNSKLDGFILWLNFYTVPDHLIDTLHNEHIWKPVFMPAFSPAIDVEEGDRIQADCLRLPGGNNLSPDYKIKGVLLKKNGLEIPFEFNMPYIEKTYKGTPFYQELFSNETPSWNNNIPISINELELRQYLEKVLPDYMIPAYFVSLKALPVTSTGKIDRRALIELASSGKARDDEYVAPTTEVEKKVVEIWERILGKKDIGMNDNFFVVGGDSIKAIQIVSRINMEGLQVKMRDIFENPRLADFTRLVKKVDKVIDQASVTGEIFLTPGQIDFFASKKVHPHHYNQAVMLYSMQGFSEEAVKAVFQKIQEHHDALRVIYTFKPDQELPVQTGCQLDYPLSLQVFDLRNNPDALEQLTIKANEIQASIDLEKGPLMKLGLFHLDMGDRLLVVIHHLVVDGISWRILFEDIETLFRQFQEGNELKLPSKTVSFKQWAQQLREYSSTPDFLKEKTWWAQVETSNAIPVPFDFPDGTNYSKDSKTAVAVLDENQTQLLLSQVHQAFQTQVNDILLTAFGLAAKQVFNLSTVAIALEGHGREDIFSGLDIGRTIGWFTSVYPVILNIDYSEDLERQIKEVKESLNRIPNKGIGHGIMKYLTPSNLKEDIQFNLQPSISFNYLGQFDSDVAEKSFGVARESAGSKRSPEQEREYKLDVSGMIANKRLVLSIVYGKNLFNPQTIETLLESYKTNLSNLIDFCASREESKATPSDFTYKDLSIDEVEDLESMFN